LWCIEQHLRQNEWIYPKTGIAGCVEGKLIYPRENVKTLRTDRRWKTEKRLQVKEVELDSPIKKILSKKAKIARKQYGGTEEQYADISLYGDWQCSPYQPPKADKGIVPTNERGNVDLTKNGEGLPDGCAYIEDKNALVAARKLKNPPHAVSALVGFEYKQGGQTLPVFLGCVVTLENEERVKEQLIKDENERVKKEKAKKLKNASLKWRTLLGAMFIKERLTAEADQKASSEFQVSLASKVEKL
jgi:xeroderma pigmentosum group C-complementing protein